MPFRTAHEAVGRLVLLGLKENRELNELSLEEMRTIVPELDEGVFEKLTLESTLASKSAAGGTSPARVAEALAAAREYLNG